LTTCCAAAEAASARLQTRAASGNGAAHSANGDGEYDYDLFTIGAGSGGVRASRFAASTYGAPALCCHPGERRTITLKANAGPHP